MKAIGQGGLALADRSGRVAFHLRYMLIGFVAVSVVINSLTTVIWLLEADTNVRAENAGQVE
jgi:hypothetical protein